MNEENFNMSMRKFLKKVGVSSQQKIEQAVQQSGKSTGSIQVKMVLSAPEIGLSHEISDNIDLD